MSMPWAASLVSRARAVMTRETPSSSSEWRMVRVPVVQFTITAVLPENIEASRNTVAPTDAGSMMPR